MKKLTPAIPWIIIVILLGYHFFKPKPVPVLTDTTDYKALLKAKDEELSITRDSLKTTRFVLENREREFQKAYDFAKQTIKDKNETKIIFYHDNDSARLAGWSEFFPSLRGRRLSPTPSTGRP